MRKSLISALLALLSWSAAAQFYTNGSDPARLKWQSVETPYYKIIYPVGADSLARVYGTLLEQFREPIGKSVGMTPGEYVKKKMPVVLHTHNAYSNGSVAWAPRRMDLYTLPDTYGSDPSPWEVQLAAHEPRHEAQMLMAYRGGLKIGTWLIGEGFSPVVWAMFLDSPLGEGDAVVAETGLAGGTRARTADFLEYFRVAYDQGDWRTWNRWRYGSFKYYAPDVYKIGYMTIAGARVFDDDPLALAKTLDHGVKMPLDWSPYNFRSTRNFRRHAERFNAVWQEDTKARAPFMQEERVSAKEAFPVNYSSPVFTGGDVYMLRSGYTRTPEIIRLAHGAFLPVSKFAYHTSALYEDVARGRIYWSETVRHPRWELDGKSVIRYLDTASGKVLDLTTKGRLYNPNPSDDGKVLLAVEQPYERSSAVVEVSADDGTILGRHPAPPGVQAAEAAWIGGRIFATGIMEGGYALYEINDGWRKLFGPVPAKIVNMDGGNDGGLEFVADLSGVNEFYRYYPDTGKAVQVTSLRYGGTDFCEVEGYLYYVSQELDGKALKRTPVSELPCREVDLTAAHAYPVEDALTAQETALGAVVDRNMPVSFTEPKPYSKILNPLKFHTWAPLYINYDSIMGDSFDFTYDNISLGATAFFQNDLNTFYGSVAYSAMPQIEDNTISDWLHSGILDITYRGLYPVFHGKFTFNKLGLSAQVTSYVPFNLSSDGWSRAVVPAIKFSGSPVETSVTAAVRAYSILPTRSSCCYPRWGIGGRIGLKKDFEVDRLLPYASIYGYLPGLWQTSGLRLGADFSLDPFVNTSIKKTDNISIASADFSAEYAIPFLSIDWNGLSPLAYVRNFEFIPKASVTRQWLTWDDPSITVSGGDTQFTILKAGADFQVVLGNIWFIPYNFRIGVGAAYVGGNPDPESKPYEINFIFKTSL